MSRKIAAALALAGGVSVHAWLGLQAIRAQSPTFDEPLHLAAGYAYWTTGDYRLNAMHHPPLGSLVGALPLLFTDARLPSDHPFWLRPQWEKAANQYGFANAFLYHNPSGLPADGLMDAGRKAILAASCLFLLALFWAARTFLGPVAAWTAFFLGVFSPSLLAHGTLVTTDYLFTAFFFLFFCCFHAWGRAEGGRRRLWAGLSGAALGLCFCGKFSAVAIGPVLLLWLCWKRFRPGFRASDILLAGAASAIAVAAVYRVGEIDLFWRGLRFTLERVQAGRATFLWGQRSMEGWWYYFPAVLALKTPPAVLAGLAAGSVFAFRGGRKPPWIFLLPPAVYFLMACASSVQIGHRYILPVYPFLFGILGAAAQNLWARRPARLAAAALGIWLAADTVTARPFFLSYMTPPARRAPHELLTDSNVDWGQGLRALKTYLREQGVNKVYLSYFGASEPAAYGFAHEAVAPYTLPAFPDAAVDLGSEPKSLLVVSATNYQSTYFAEDIFGWLRSRAPEAVVARSLLVFDVTGDAGSRERLAWIFERMGKPESARRERRRAAELAAAPRGL